MKKISKKIAQTLQDQNTHIWYMAGEPTHGEADMLMVAVGEEGAGPFVLQEDDKFIGTPESLVAHIKQNHPTVRRVVADPRGMERDTFIRLGDALRNGGLQFEEEQEADPQAEF